MAFPPRNRPRTLRTLSVAVLFSLVALVASCGGEAADEGAGVRVVSVDAASEILSAPPQDLVVLDVRTPDEFAAGHLEGATLIDFYESDFSDRIADLDRDAPYLLYCRSGNRSGTTRALMEELGFTNVADVDGGINAWAAAGQSIVR